MRKFNLYAIKNDLQTEEPEFLCTLQAKNRDDLNKKYKLNLIDTYDGVISQLNKKQINQFFLKNNINFNVAACNKVQLLITCNFKK